MITVRQATEIIHQLPFRAGITKVKLSDATGRVLAENIKADRDLPPFHRATMDGIAICFDDYKNGKRDFVIGGLQAAGQPQLELNTGCIEITTGAILPKNTDTVVRYEDITIDQNIATINVAIVPYQSVHHRGADALEDQILLTTGTTISPAEIAILASVGKHEVGVYEIKPFAIVVTGDELVDIEQSPLPYQIRKSNGAALSSSLQMLSIPSEIYHLPDDADILRSQLTNIIHQHDVIILSGGVSKGKSDHIPTVLEELGVKKLFHQVKQRPGKPFWFGRTDSKTIFALPGNPVSTFLCFHRYIKPWIEAGLGVALKNIKAILAEDFTFKPDLTYFLQVKIDASEGMIAATPDAGVGSGDFVNLKDVDGFIELPSERNDFKKGEAFNYIPFR